MVLEAQLTKAGMHNLMIGVENSKQGMDFYFKQKNQAEKVVNFISTHLPMKSKFSKKHISTDPRSGKTRFELTYAVDIAPLGRGDLLLMPTNLNSKNSSAGEVVLVSKVASSIHLINPVTLKRDELTASRYFSKEKHIRSLMSPAELVRFVILDIEPLTEVYNSGDDGRQNGIKESGGLLADAEVRICNFLLLFETICHLSVIFNYDFQVARESDLGFNDKTFHIRTHLGHLLKPGDMALGYDMVRYASSGGIEANTWLQHLSKGRDRSSTVNVSDVILVKKCFEDDLKKKVNTKKKSRRRTRPKKEGIDVAHEQIVDDSTLEAVDDSTLEGVNESNVFSFPNAVDELSVVNEELSDYDDVDDNFEEDDPDEDVADLEGLFSHLVDRNVDKQK